MNFSDYWFDEDAAVRSVTFFEKYLFHIKGKWAGAPFLLMDWQKKIIRELFGWKIQDGTRKYRVAYIEIPRKNGKSTLAAGIALYLEFADKEFGAEIYSAAADRDQAAIVFETAKSMVEISPSLSKRAKPYKRSIFYPDYMANYKVLSADAATKHGLNAHGVIFDELHAQKHRELWDVLTTSTGSREQPLVVAITTAGYDKNTICGEQHDYAEQVLKGVIEDPAYYAFIAAADTDDDWKIEETWKKANPGYGITVTPGYLKREAKRAEHVPAYQNTFRRLHLDQWTKQSERWLDLAFWDKCSKKVNIKALKGKSCYCGLDLASSIDIAAFAKVFSDEKGFFDILMRFWVPEENIRERSLRDKVPYDVWVRDGYIKATPGNVIDYSAIETDIKRDNEFYDIREIAFDRWGAVQMTQNLEAEGFTVVPFGQGFKSMSPPTKELLKLVMSRKVRHGGNPVLRWMADNMVVSTDPAENVKPDKKKSTERIDGMVALIMGLDRAIRQNEDETKVEVWAV